MIDLALVGLLTLHLAAVSIAAIGPLFALFFEWRQSRHGDEWSGWFGRLLAQRSWEFLLVGTLLGLAQLGLLWSSGRPEFLHAVRAMEPSRWWFAGAEFTFSLIALIIYWVTWNSWRRVRFLHGLLALVAATNIAYHFPALFVIVGVVGQRPELWDSTVAMRSMLRDGEVLARIGHFLLASVAACSVFVLWQAARSALVRKDAEAVQSTMEWAGRVALLATLAQLPLGLIVLARMPNELRQQLLGGDMLATCTFGAGIAIVIALLHHLGAVSFGDNEPRTVKRTVGLLLLVLLLMIGARQQTRVETRSNADATAAMRVSGSALSAGL